MKPIAFTNTYVTLPERFFQRVEPQKVASPALVRANRALAEQLGIDFAYLESPEGVGMVAGNQVVEGSEPIATAYAGHQFGHFNPQLGDGRALLLGEVLDTRGQRYDLQLKGSGRTPFSRGGDGRSPLGPVLREYIVSEAMAALDIPTTRALAAVTTGEPVMREAGPLPGGVLLRVARSHVRVGTFEYFAARNDVEALRILVDYALQRHYPDQADADCPALALLQGVAERQAELVARWQLVGFIHGVMNTDNTLVSGETIDFGPCAFMDAYDPASVFSSIDHHGRYAYQNQPPIMQWNVACLARALLPLIGEERVAAAQAIIDALPERYQRAYHEGLRRKLGLSTEEPEDQALGEELLQHFHDTQIDFTLGFRKLADLADPARDARAPATPLGELFAFSDAFTPWLSRWQSRLSRDPRDAPERAADMRHANPALIARNHLVEAAIRDAEDRADFTRFHMLVDALATPDRYHEDLAELARPPREEERVRHTFCGT